MPKKSSKKHKKIKGFTVTELLAIIAVVGILALIALTAYAPTRAKARDSKRITEINHLRNALQLYYMDHGKYPDSNPVGEWCFIDASAGSTNACPSVLNELASYLPSTPSDPLFGKGQEPDEDVFYSYQYISTSSGGGYKLHADLEATPPYYYELGSFLGSSIVYVPGGGGGGGGGSSQSQFIKILGGSGGEYIQSAQQTSDGGYIMTGWTFSFGGSGGDVLLAKLDDSYNVSWAKMTGGSGLDEANSVQQTSDGGYIVSGYTTSYGAGNYDFLLIKFNSSGDIDWARAIGTSTTDNGWSVQQTSFGEYIAVGETNGYVSPSNYDLFWVKLAADGNFIEAKKIGGTATEISRMIQKTSDGFIITGRTSSYGAGGSDVLLVKLDSDGNYLWSKAVGTATNNERGTYAQQTSDGGYIMAGNIGATYDFFLAKLDSAGDIDWARTMGGAGEDQAYGVLEMSDGYIINGLTENYGAGGIDSLLVKFDLNGNYLWAKTWGSGGDDLVFSGIKKTSDGGFIASGWTEGWDAVNLDWFLTKFNSDGDTCAGTSSITIAPVDITSSIVVTSLTITPNSVNPVITPLSLTANAVSPNEDIKCSQ